jgi:hypothetical protein
MTQSTQQEIFRLTYRSTLMVAALLVALGVPGLPVKAMDKGPTDSDRDGQERVLATDPNIPDTDSDGLKDGWEVAGFVPALTLKSCDVEKPQR